MEKPIVSTITPCFRMERFLATFLEWLPRQTFFLKMEVVLDHNEPTENEVALVKAFQKKYPGRLKHIIVKKADPIGTSMNRCIEQASGEFVTIWNVDDLRTDNSIELQARALLDNPDIGLVYGNYRIVRQFGSTSGKIVEHGQISHRELTRGMIVGPFYMFRKSLCEKAGYFDEQLVSGADFDLAVRLGFNTSAKMVCGELGYYLREGQGASSRPNSKQVLERTVICMRYGMFNRMDWDSVPRTITYNIPNIIQFGKWVRVDTLVPDYKKVIDERYDETFMRGLKKVKHKIIYNLKVAKYAAIRKKYSLLSKVKKI